MDTLHVDILVGVTSHLMGMASPLVLIGGPLCWRRVGILMGWRIRVSRV